MYRKCQKNLCHIIIDHRSKYLNLATLQSTSTSPPQPLSIIWICWTQSVRFRFSRNLACFSCRKPFPIPTAMNRTSPLQISADSWGSHEVRTFDLAKGHCWQALKPVNQSAASLVESWPARSKNSKPSIPRRTPKWKGVYSFVIFCAYHTSSDSKFEKRNTTWRRIGKGKHVILPPAPTTLCAFSALGSLPNA